MKVVVDSNIIFSAILPQSKKTRDILFLQKELDFYSCSFALVEIFKYKEKILKAAQLEEEKLLRILHRILRRITFYREDLIHANSLKLAKELCFDIDMKDMYFVALTIEMDGILWTGDVKLKKGLTKKGFDKFLTTLK